jgi:Na+-transporting NADH:ubiquinone oxidoreductase subunit D
MANEKTGAIIKRNLFTDNQVLRAILGICSSLAVTNTMRNSLVMGLGVAFVTGLSSLTLSAMRSIIPHRVRMLVQTLVIADYVIFVDLFLQAFLPDISKQLGPYVGLIITNCIIMGRAEAYAQQNPPLPAMWDGLFAGLGYTLVLLFISLIREVLGFGTIFGTNVNFVGFETWTIMIMPPAAFFIIGAMIWFMSARTAKKAAVKAK